MHVCLSNKTAGVIVAVIDDEDDDTEVQTVIDNLDLASQRFTPQYLFVMNKLRCQAADLEAIDRGTYQARMKAARSEFNNSSATICEFWAGRQREHLRKWPTIKDSLMRELRKNNSIGYEKLASAIDYWCSHCTICKWVQS